MDTPAESAITRHTVSMRPFEASLLLTRTIGVSRNGNRTNAEIVTEPGNVSVKTTAIWYVPFGVEAKVAIVTVLEA
jgi:hypothetical protein